MAHRLSRWDVWHILITVYPGMAEDAGPIPRHGALVLTSVEESKSSSWDPLNVGVFTGRKGCSYCFSGCCGLLTQEEEPDRAVISEARKASEKALGLWQEPCGGRAISALHPQTYTLFTANHVFLIFTNSFLKTNNVPFMNL